MEQLGIVRLANLNRKNAIPTGVFFQGNWRFWQLASPGIIHL
jgi:hypothetical protein